MDGIENRALRIGSRENYKWVDGRGVERRDKVASETVKQAVKEKNEGKETEKLYEAKGRRKYGLMNDKGITERP